jgi:hypothetical protein
MAEVVASAENYSITVDGARAVLRVWRNPELDSKTGAQHAEEIVGQLLALTKERVTSILYDATEAPPVAGPRTQAALEGLFRSCERKQVPFAIVYGDDAVRALQLRRLVTTCAPRHGCAVRDLAEAEAFLGAAAISRR